MILEFLRPADLPAIDNDQLGALISAAIQLVGTDASATATIIFVEHAQLTEAARPTIQAIIEAYVFDPGPPPVAVRSIEDRLAALEALLGG